MSQYVHFWCKITVLSEKHPGLLQVYGTRSLYPTFQRKHGNWLQGSRAPSRQYLLSRHGRVRLITSWYSTREPSLHWDDQSVAEALTESGDTMQRLFGANKALKSKHMSSCIVTNFFLGIGMTGWRWELGRMHKPYTMSTTNYSC